MTDTRDDMLASAARVAAAPLAEGSDRRQGELAFWSVGDPVPSYAHYRRWRTCSDLYRRALVGPAFYIVTCLFIWLVGQFSKLSEAALGAGALLFGLLWWLRWANRLPPTSADDARFAAWYRREWVLIFAGYALWSVLVALLGVEQGSHNMVVILLVLATAVYTAAACIAFTVDVRLQAWLLLLLMAPFVLVWLPAGPALRELAYAYLVCWLWAGMSGRNYCGEYERQIRLEHELLVSHADNERLAHTDTLTGLPNRREFETVYAAAWNQRSRGHDALSLLAIDIDHFKQINDTRGHLAGDIALQHVAQLLRGYFRRANDFVARVGGEEFVVLLPGSSIDEAAAMAEAFRALLARSPCVHDGDRWPMAASIGVGEVLPGKDATPDATFSRIDRACYAAKSAGRDRVERAPAP